MVARLCRWCKQNSGSYNLEGLRSMADMLARDFGELGRPMKRIAVDPIRWIDDGGEQRFQQSGDLLVVEHNPKANHRFLMMIHYDTVYPPSEFTTAVEFIADNKLRGPGTADAKGGLLVMFEAARVLGEFGLDQEIGWTLAVNPDEEIGSPASSSWIRENATKFDFGLLFEPTLPDGSLVSSRKGSGNFTIIVRGRSAHAGRNPQAGRNAVVHLCRLLAHLDRLNREIAGVTVNVAKVSGGGALNQVPDLAIGRLNIRVVDSPMQQLVMEKVGQTIAQFNAEDGFSVVLEGEFQSPPKVCTPRMEELQQRVERACHLVGRSVSWRPTGGACDGSKLSAAGLVNVDTLGPTGDGLHSAEEWIDTRSLVPAAKTIVALATEYACSQKTV